MNLYVFMGARLHRTSQKLGVSSMFVSFYGILYTGTPNFLTFDGVAQTP